MLSDLFILLCSGAFLSLRVGSAPGSFPRPLSAEEERALLSRWNEGDIEARNRLIEHNLRLVAHIAKKYYTVEGDQDDLISIGTIGLIKGISTYRADKGVRLATYASRCIENEVLMHFRSQRKNALNVSLSDTPDADDESDSLSLLDTLCDEEDMAETLSRRETCEVLRSLTEKVLTPRERRILTLRYGLGGAEALTQSRTAELCGISRSYVSRLEKKALDKLRKALEAEHFSP